MTPNPSPLKVPDLINLQCFITLSKSLSFKDAAASMTLSPAAFSDRIKRLEDQLGSALFERTTRKVKLSLFGSRLVPHAQTLLNSTSRWIEATNLAGSQVPYTIRLGTRFELGMSWIVPSLNQLKNMNGQRSINLKWGTDQELLSMLKKGEIDALVSSVRVRKRSLNILPLHREEYVLVASPNLELNNLKVGDASHLHLIDTEEDLPLFRYYTESLLSGDPWVFKGYEFMGTIAAVKSRVLEGVGIAVLPLYFVYGDLQAKTLINLSEDHALKHDFFRLIWREDLIYKTALSELADDLVKIPLA